MTLLRHLTTCERPACINRLTPEDICHNTHCTWKAWSHLFLPFCSSHRALLISKSECQSGEWHAAGYKGASRGLTSSRFKAYAKACAKHGIAADNTLYTAGYEDGLEVLCQPKWESGRVAQQNIVMASARLYLKATFYTVIWKAWISRCMVWAKAMRTQKTN